MSNKITRCISCGSDKIRKKRGLFPVNVRGETERIPDIDCNICSRCGETFLDLDNETKIDLYLDRRRTGAVASRSS